MPQIATADFKNGMTIDLDEGLFNIVEFQHVKPGKGGAFVRTTLKNSRTGAVVERTFRAGERMERAIIDKREMQLLYRDGGDYVFMDNESYEQMNVSAATLGDSANYLVDSSTAMLQMYGDEIIGVELPASVVLNIAETEPGVQGDRVSGAKKPATLVTGLVVAVPLFINPGEAIKVDTRSGDFISLGMTDEASDPSDDGPPSVRPVIGGRHEARERAVHLLYEMAMKGRTADEVLSGQVVAADRYTADLVTGVDDHSDELDGVIGRLAKGGWSLERMPTMDVLVLRTACYELAHRPDVPTGAILSEAVDLAGRYGTDDSSRFVNGLLASAAAELRPDEAPPA